MKVARSLAMVLLTVVAASAVEAERFWEYTIPAGSEWREFEPDRVHGGPWVVHWVQGAMVGEVAYHDRVGGQKSWDRPMRNGHTHGTERRWWPDGSPLWAKTYKNGTLHGLYATWVGPDMLAYLHYYLNGYQVSQSQYIEAWEKDQALLPPPTLFGLPGSWVGGQDPDETLSADDRTHSRTAEQLLNEGMEEFNKGKPPITSGPNEVPPNPEADALRKLEAALGSIMKISDPRKRAELLLRAAHQVISYRQKVVNYEHIQQFADVAEKALDRVPDAIGKMDDPQLRAQYYRTLSQQWRSLARIALFHHPTLTPTYCDQKREHFAQLAEQESRRTGGGGGVATGGGGAATATRMSLPQMGISFMLPAGFTALDSSSIPVLLKGPADAVAMLVHMEQGPVDLQEFATLFMQGIGPAMGAGDLQELGRDTMDVGEGMPGLLTLAQATVENTSAEFAFLFFSANDRVYTFAYFAPAAQFDQHSDAFFNLLQSVTVGG